MSDLNFESLNKNIATLIKKNNLTQAQFAEAIGMTQANVSKALNPNESKQFTIDQIFRISQQFRVSIDELVGNKIIEDTSINPDAVLECIVNWLCTAKMRTTKITEEEWVYDQYLNEHGYPDCKPEKKNIEYIAFYFPDYFSVFDLAFNEVDQEETHYEFLSGGNSTKFQEFNRVIKKLLPMVKLYQEKEIPEDAFNMIVKGYIEHLSDK